MNGYDANAVEAALQLRDRFGGRVTVISAGADSAQSILREALAMGVDEVRLLEAAQPRVYDPVRTAAGLAEVIRAIGSVDLVVCGRQASDTDGGQVPAMVATLLGWVLISPVTHVEEDGDDVVVRRPLPDGYQRLRVSGPTVLAVSSETNEPRFPKMLAAAKARKAFIAGEPLPGDDAAEPRVRLRRLAIPEQSGHAEMLEGANPGAELADRLHEMGLIR
jgi:electron transfer flavoprotein beta subunit